MIIGYSFFQGNCFDSNINIDSVYKMDLENAIFDEVKVDSGKTMQPNKDKQAWGNNTLLKAEFKDNLFEAGNITLGGIPIEFLRIKKRKLNELTWQTYKDIPFDAKRKGYTWTDYFVESLQDYEYAVLPVGAQNTEGQYSMNFIECEYQDVYILGQNNQQYKLIYNIELGDIETITPSSVVETLGSKYPFEITNGNIQYRKGNIRAMILSDNTASSRVIDRKEEKKLRTEIYNFLTNKKPKVIKTGEGVYMLISIKNDSVRLNPIQDVGRYLYNISFDFVEIDDIYNVGVLQSYGLI